MTNSPDTYCAGLNFLFSNCSTILNTSQHKNHPAKTVQQFYDLNIDLFTPFKPMKMYLNQLAEMTQLMENSSKLVLAFDDYLKSNYQDLKNFEQFRDHGLDFFYS